MNDSYTDIKSFTLPELKDFISGLGEKAFRAVQLYEWMHVKLVSSYDEMRNIPKALKEKLENTAYLVSLDTVRELISSIDGTRKYLFRLHDGNIIESVMMRYEYGISVCVSSQAGCRMGCRFCASTIDGLERNLTASEMLDQVYQIQKITGERVSHVVIMGSGEPLDNYENVLRFIDLLSNSDGLNISQRNITASTCGIVPKMYDLADRKLGITLAVSLHASTDEKRREIMPIANKYSISEIMEACKYYFENTGRRVSFEYSLIAGVNDSQEDADRLVKLISPLHAHINLIPVNPVEERDYRQSNRERISAFSQKLEKCRINVTIRREMGRDISGACGQLRRHFRGD